MHLQDFEILLNNLRQDYTASFMDLDQDFEMTIFLVDFHHFKTSSIFKTAGSVEKTDLSLKSNYHRQIRKFNLHKSVKHTVRKKD